MVLIANLVPTSAQVNRSWFLANAGVIIDFSESKNGSLTYLNSDTFDEYEGECYSLQLTEDETIFVAGDNFFDDGLNPILWPFCLDQIGCRKHATIIPNSDGSFFLSQYEDGDNNVNWLTYISKFGSINDSVYLIERDVVSYPQRNILSSYPKIDECGVHWVVNRRYTTNTTDVGLIKDGRIESKIRLKNNNGNIYPVNITDGFSPDGRYLLSKTTGNGSMKDGFWLLGFNPRTGLTNKDIWIGHVEGDSKFAFSSDSKFLYLLRKINTNDLTGIETVVYQYDLSKGSDAFASQYEVYRSGIIPNIIPSYSDIALAPNGQIYLSSRTSKYMAVIQPPVFGQASCTFIEEGLYVGEDAFGENPWLPEIRYSHEDVEKVEIYVGTPCLGESCKVELTSNSLIQNLEFALTNPAKDKQIFNSQSFEFIPKKVGDYLISMRWTSCSGSHQIDTIISIEQNFRLSDLDTTVCSQDLPLMVNIAPEYLLDISASSDLILADEGIRIEKEGTHYLQYTYDCEVQPTIIKLKVKEPPVYYKLPTELWICDNTKLIYFDISDSLIWKDNYVSDNQILVTEPGLYSVNIINQCGRLSHDILVKQVDGLKPYWPNAISSNFDDLNDLFRLSNSTEIEHFHLVLFDKWGSVLFETNNPSFEWDPTDYYLNNSSIVGYVVNLKLACNSKNLSYTGVLTIIK